MHLHTQRNPEVQVRLGRVSVSSVSAVSSASPVSSVKHSKLGGGGFSMSEVL